jgi:threonine dehydratase
MIPSEWLDEANQRLKGRVKVTPLLEDARAGWFIKWENQQETGSFKLRGALNKVLTLLPEERSVGLVCASAGNHGQGVAVAGRQVGAQVIVFASEHAVPTKLAAMQQLGAEVRLVAGGYAEAEAAGKVYAQKTGMTWISPYNDIQVICGQATLGFEILEQMKVRPFQEIYLPAGGGGLATGIGAVLKQFAPHVKVIAVQSEASAYLHRLFHQGSQVEVIEQETLADGLAGAVEEGAITIPLVKQMVDDFVLVGEEEIGRAIAFAWRRYGEQIEGSAAVSLAAARRYTTTERPAIVVVTGGNIQPETHAGLLAQYPQEGI